MVVVLTFWVLLLHLSEFYLVCFFFVFFHWIQILNPLGLVWILFQVENWIKDFLFVFVKFFVVLLEGSEMGVFVEVQNIEVKFFESFVQFHFLFAADEFNQEAEIVVEYFVIDLWVEFVKAVEDFEEV